MRDVTTDSFEIEVLRATTPQLVLFTAPWVGPGRVMIESFTKAGVEKTTNTEILVLNVDDHPSVAQQYGITSVPTLLCFADGKLVDRAVGALPASALTKFIHRNKPALPETPPLTSASPWLAVGLFGNALRVVSLELDGRYTFIDQRGNTHRLLYASTLAEAQARREVASEFEALINRNDITEQALHRFMELNPEFILNDEYKAAHSKVVLDRDDAPLIPDFMLEPVDQNALCDLLELKRPDTRLFVIKKNRLRFSAAVFEAVAQLREYSRFFDEQHNRERVKQRYGLHAFKPRLFLILGRSVSVDPIVRRVAEQDVPGVVLRTYDDLLTKIRGGRSS